MALNTPIQAIRHQPFEVTKRTRFYQRVDLGEQADRYLGTYLRCPDLGHQVLLLSPDPSLPRSA